MTTEELITKLKALGVEDVQAEGFSDIRLKVSTPGGTIRIPVFTSEYVFYQVEARTTDQENGYVPLWDAITKLPGETA